MNEPEGVIKYHCIWTKQAAIEKDVLGHLLMQGRLRLHVNGFIGVNHEGVGFGNISLRWHQKDQFIITGSQTGHLPELTTEQLSLVTEFDLEKNELHCQGPIKASSEAISHGIIYEQAKWVNCIIHIHHEQLWTDLINKVPTTSPSATYGTQEMALEIAKIIGQSQEKACQLIVMAGHKPGLIVFGDAIQRTIDYLLGVDLDHSSNSK